MWVGGVKLYVVGFTAYQISKILFIIFANYYRTTGAMLAHYSFGFGHS